MHLQSLYSKLDRPTDTKSIMGMSEKADDDDKEEERGQWSNPCDFFISCLGYAVGLGDLLLIPSSFFYFAGSILLQGTRSIQHY